ncbi:hypothetical protein Tco_0564644 [Tanacetum coccineum]
MKADDLITISTGKSNEALEVKGAYRPGLKHVEYIRVDVLRAQEKDVELLPPSKGTRHACKLLWKQGDRIAISRLRELVNLVMQVALYIEILMPPKRTSTSEAPAMTQATIRKLVADSIATALEAKAATMANIQFPYWTKNKLLLKEMHLREVYKLPTFLVQRTLISQTTPNVPYLYSSQSYEPHAKKDSQETEQSTSIVDWEVEGHTGPMFAHKYHICTCSSSPSTPSPQPTAHLNDALRPL